MIAKELIDSFLSSAQLDDASQSDVEQLVNAMGSDADDIEFAVLEHPVSGLICYDVPDPATTEHGVRCGYRGWLWPESTQSGVIRYVCRGVVCKERGSTCAHMNMASEIARFMNEGMPVRSTRNGNRELVSAEPIPDHTADASAYQAICVLRSSHWRFADFSTCLCGQENCICRFRCTCGHLLTPLQVR